MKFWRILYLEIVVVSLGLAFIFHYQYRLKSDQLAQYKELSSYSYKAFKKINARLTQNKKEFAESVKKSRDSNRTIATLEKDSLNFKNELQALKEERAGLQLEIARLAEEKSVLQKRLLNLEAKFHSRKELKKQLKSLK